MNTLRINLWSGPRNISTALMYSFAQRADTRVIDEPLYAHYLRVSGAAHPGRDEVLAVLDSDGERAVRDVILGPCDRQVLFLKQMAHHLVGLDRSFLGETAHVLLTRDPREMLASLAKQLPLPTMADTGLPVQVALLDELRRAGRDPPVIDARELLFDPPGVLRTLCDRLDIPFDPAMLHWPAGPKPYDGVWAKYWYAAAHRSTGFQPYQPKDEPLPERLRPLLDACLPYFETLRAARGVPDPGRGR